MINVNLLRPEKKEVKAGEKQVSYIEEEKERKFNTSAVIAAVVVSLGSIIMLYFLQDIKFQREQKTLEERRLRKQELQRVLQKLAEVEATKKALDMKIKVIGDLKSRQKDTVKMMDKLSSSLPEWVWLTGVQYAGNSVKIEGKAMSNNLISDFISNLKASSYFTNINFIGSVRASEGVSEFYTFSLSCDYIRPPEDINKAV